MKRLLRASVLLASILFPALVVLATCANLKKELAAQHFSGVLKGDVSFKALGTFPCGKKRYRVIYYSWSETNPPGVAEHASYRIIFMDGRTYIGSYIVPQEPNIQGDVLRFPYSAYGDTITCGRKGMLPKNAWLDGELYLFSK